MRFGRHRHAERRLVAGDWTLHGTRLAVTERGGVRTLSTRLVGEHNALNAVGALALADALGIDPDLAADAIGDVPALPRRFELIQTPGACDVVVDFAHNPDGVRRVIAAARAILAERGSGRCGSSHPATGSPAPARAGASGTRRERARTI